MRLIDADAIDTRYSDPEVVETLNGAPTVDAVPVSKINEAMGKIERGLQACFNMVHCESSHDLLEGQEKAFKYCLDVLQEACGDSGED